MTRDIGAVLAEIGHLDVDDASDDLVEPELVGRHVTVQEVGELAVLIEVTVERAA